MKHPCRAPVRGALAALCTLPALALALPPDQVFERVAPALWALRLLGPDGQARDVGSAVALAAGKAVTACAQLPSGGRLALQREKTSLAATLEFADIARDLCQLDVPGLQAPEAPRAAPRLGQRVYAIGYERGAEISIGEGLVARLREPGSDNERIQTSIATSGWLLGAGLFDDEGRLLGITTAPGRDGAMVVLAVPARWIAEVPARGKTAQVAAAGDPAGVLPRAGASWTYAYTMRGTDRARFDVVVRVTGLEQGVVQESITIPASAERKLAVSANALAFRSVPLPRSQVLLELAPYLHAQFAKGEDRMWGQLAGYPRGAAVLPAWTITAREMGEEEVTVPAGTFKAIRVQVAGRRSFVGNVPFHLNHEASRFVFEAWYAPQARRYVRARHETWALRGEWSGEQIIELLSHAQ